MRRPVSWPRVAGAWALLLPGVIAFQPTFGGLAGYVAASVGITLGAVVALVGHQLRWRVGYRVLALLGCYFLVGGAVAVPDTTLAGFVPTLETIRRLGLLLFQAWHDLLTVATPAGEFSGPAAVPLMAGLVAGFAMIWAVVATSAIHTPLLVPLAWLGFAIAFGVRTAPNAVWLGVAFGAGILGWQTAHRLAGTRHASAAILLRKERGVSRGVTAALTAVAVIAASTAVAALATLPAADRVNRQVLRDDIVPPVTLHEYTSPLMAYRGYELTLKDEVLFEVRGMPAGARLRLAVLESYDGNVFDVAQQANRYLRSGRQLPVTVTGDTARVEVAVVGYEGVWVPTVGESARIEFEGDHARREARGLHFNKASQQALTTVGIAEGSRFVVEAVPVIPLDEQAREAMGAAGPGRGPVAAVERVPEALVRGASEWTAEAASAAEQMALITERMRADGFYSDGSDGLTRSGHTSERLSSMFAANQWIGDDEQYATALALMASQLGIPVRVVLGFHPLDGDAPGDVWQVTGTEAHVWVEAHLDGVGWVSFDPTPDRDKTPQTDTPQPKPKPKPQVDPPPDPPEKLPDEVIVPEDDAANVDEDDRFDLSWLLALLAWLGIAAGSAVVIGSPFLSILALKRVRAQRRATRGDTADQMAGAWDEIVDRARDMGYAAPTSSTRREWAAGMQQTFPEIPLTPLADGIDASVFAEGTPDAGRRDAAWERSAQARQAMLGTLAWYRRPVAVFSVRSLRRRTAVAAGRPGWRPRLRDWSAGRLRPSGIRPEATHLSNEERS